MSFLISIHKSIDLQPGCSDAEPGKAPVDRRLGCEWVSGEGDFRFVKRCVQHPQDPRKTRVDLVRCYYAGFELRPGCFRPLPDGQLVAACSRDVQDGRPKLTTVHVQQMKQLLDEGMQFCY